MNNRLLTRWGRELLSDPSSAQPQSQAQYHPTPTLRRSDESWFLLDGWWEFEITEAPREYKTLQELERPSKFTSSIRVPFPIESDLSGVGRILEPGETAWYRREFRLPDNWKIYGPSTRAILRIQAVDWECAVFLNDRLLGTHRGGYDSFAFDISELARINENELLLLVRDPTSDGVQPRGKQVLRPHGIWYTPCSGIWQDVWVELVPDTYISSILLSGDPLTKTATANIRLEGPQRNAKSEAVGEVVIEIGKGDEVLGVGKGDPAKPIEIELFDEPHPWSPEDPFLFDATIRLETAGAGATGATHADEVSSYLGFRRIEVKDFKGIPRIHLNGTPRFLYGFLDQGYWPDGIYTPPSDEALVFDISLAQQLGANTLRKHVKVESERFYYWCDRIGMLVLQDIPSGTFGYSDEGRQIFRDELEALIETRGRHPSIVGWVVFNEGWGQHDTCEHVEWLLRKDPTRLVVGASGWVDKGCGHIADLHVYPGMEKLGEISLSQLPNVWYERDSQSAATAAKLGISDIPSRQSRALILGEFGGLGLRLQGHLWSDSSFSYKLTSDTQDLTSQYVQMLSELEEAATKGLSGAIYTQLSDVESEHNGVMTYDREVVKVDISEARRAAERLVGMTYDL
jgi:beta-galactosidase/beta-glucuronidase